MTKVKSNTKVKAQTKNSVEPKNAISEMEALKVRMQELKAEQKAAKEALKLQVDVAKAAQAKIKEEERALKLEAQKAIEAENAKKTEAAYNSLIVGLQTLIEDVANEAEKSKANLSMYLGGLPTLRKRIVSMLPSGNNADSAQRYIAREAREYEKAINVLKSGEVLTGNLLPCYNTVINGNADYKTKTENNETPNESEVRRHELFTRFI